MRNVFGLLLLIFVAAVVLNAQSSNHGSENGSFIQVEGGRLYYEECGSGSKAVVLLHDGVVNSAVWDNVWPAFCRQFHTVRYDRRGYGRSPETKKPYYETDDVAALLHELKIKQAALVASSHGGNIALNFALRYPAQVSDLVLVGPSAEGFPPSEEFLKSQVVLENAKDPIEVRVQSSYFIVPGHDAAREQLRKYLLASPQDHTHNDMPISEKPVFPYVQDLRVPTLILIGSADIADNQAIAGALVMAIPGAARTVVPDTGHLMYLEKPGVFVNLVSTFLNLHQF